MTWAVPRFDHLVDFAGASHAGKVRSSNEDVWRVDPGLGLFAVADGMGGHAAGEVAARLAVDELGKVLRAPASLAVLDAFVANPGLDTRRAVFELMGRAAEASHQVVKDSAAKDLKRRGMGCTLDAVLLLGSKALVVHAGDGRTYLSRPLTTIQLTHDHTLHGSLMARGVMSPSDRPTGGNTLTNAVGRKGELSVDEVFLDLSEGDRLVLCTDGVHGEIEEEKAITELARRGKVDEVAVGLVGAALDRGGTDNATVVVVEVGARREGRGAKDAGLDFRDSAFAFHCALFRDVPPKLVEKALRAAVEVEFEAGENVPRYQASDRVGYVVLEGRIESPSGWTHGPSALVYPESLARGGHGTSLCRATERTRALRVRSDDFREVCQTDSALAAFLYERLSHMLARGDAG
jgi:serine/threonine protein phosphatase PrpC